MSFLGHRKIWNHRVFQSLMTASVAFLGMIAIYLCCLWMGYGDTWVVVSMGAAMVLLIMFPLLPTLTWKNVPIMRARNEYTCYLQRERMVRV